MHRINHKMVLMQFRTAPQNDIPIAGLQGMTHFAEISRVQDEYLRYTSVMWKLYALSVNFEREEYCTWVRFQFTCTYNETKLMIYTKSILAFFKGLNYLLPSVFVGHAHAPTFVGHVIFLFWSTCLTIVLFLKGITRRN